jgi:hypothetical protein
MKPEVLVLSFVAVISFVACSTGSQTASSAGPCPPSGENCPPMDRFITNTRSLGCFINGYHMIEIGNPTGVAIPKGTPLSFTAKLMNAGLHCATVSAPRDVPPHLFVPITGQPLLDQQGPCDAWWSPPLVVNPGIR